MISHALISLFILSGEVEPPVLPEVFRYPLEKQAREQQRGRTEVDVSPLYGGPRTYQKVDPKDVIHEKSHPLASILCEVFNNDPKLDAARLQIAIEHERNKQTHGNYRPRVDIAGLYTNTHERFSGIKQHDSSYKMSLIVSQPIIDRTAGYLDHSTALDIDRAHLTTHLQSQDVMQEITRRYIDLHRFALLAEFSRNNAGLANEHLRSTRIRQEAGELTITDVAQALVRYQTAHSIEVESRVQDRIAQYRYQELVQGDLPEDIKPFIIRLPEEDMKDMLKEEHALDRPDLQILRTRKKQEELQLQMSYAKDWPIVFLNLEQGRTWDTDAGAVSPLDESVITVSMNWNLYNGGATQSRIEESRLRIAQLEHNYVHQKKQGLRLLHETAGQMEIARELTKSYWKAVEAAKKALFGIQEEFLVGTRTALDAFDAQNELFISQTRWLNAKIDHLLYVVDFFKTAGKLDLKNFATRLEFEPEESEEDEGNENTEHQNEAQP